MLQDQERGEFGGERSNSARDMLLALGANLASVVGSPVDSLRAALKMLSSNGVAIRAVSPLYSTPAFPAGNGPDYVNAAARISADMSPAAMLDLLHRIEGEMGRERLQRWGQRTLDLDLIACDDMVLPDRETHAAWRNLPPEEQVQRTPERLILPHPRLQDRAFVLVPLADVAPDWRHPVLNLTVLEMRDALDPADLDAVRWLENSGATPL